MFTFGTMYLCILSFYDNSREDSPVLDEEEENTEKPSETHRQNDAMVVKRAFASSRKV